MSKCKPGQDQTKIYGLSALSVTGGVVDQREITPTPEGKKEE